MLKNTHPKLSLPPDVIYKRLVEHMNEAVWMGDEHERTVYANPKFCEIMGYTLKEMLGRESYEFWDEESAKRVKDVNLTKRKKGVSSSYEGNLLTKDGKKIPVLLSGTPLPDGGTIGIMTNLTELKKKEESEKILGSAVQYATDAIVIFDNKGQITTWNKGAKIMFGYKREEMVHARLEKIFPKDSISDLLQHSSVLYNIELKGMHKNKQPIDISATLTPIFSEDKRTTAYCLLIARDITNQTKFEEELTLKYQKLKEVNNKFGIIRRQMDYIFEILDLLKNHNDPKTVADFIVSSIIMLTRVDACILRRYNSQKDILEFVAGFGVDESWKGKASLRYHKSLLEKAVLKKAPLKIIDVTKEPRYHSAYLAKKHNLCSLLLIPLQCKGKLVGSLSLYASPQKKLEIFENEFIEKYAKLVEIAVGTTF